MDPEQIDSLVSRARQGDREAVGDLLTQWQAELNGFVKRRAGRALLEKESGCDIVQSACREVLSSMADIEISDGREGFKAWLFSATLRKIIDRHRFWAAGKRDRMRENSRRWSNASIDALAVKVTSAGEEVVRAETAARIREIVSTLPEHYEEVLRLAHFEGLSRREVAERMGRSEVSVRSLLARAMARLTRLVHQQFGDQ